MGVNMRDLRLKIGDFEYISFLECKCSVAFQKHGEFYVKGLISKENAKSYQNILDKELWISVKYFDEYEEEKIFFCGVLVEATMLCENELFVLTLIIKSGSFLMDLQQHFRTFQGSNTSFGEIMLTCTKDYKNGNFIMFQKSKNTIDDLFIQYRETDWRFIKRVSSALHLPILPETLVEGSKIYIGIPNRKKIQKSKEYNYTILKNRKEFLKKNHLGISETDVETYVISSREIYNVGDSLEFLNKEFCIAARETIYKGNEWIHTYYLRTFNGMMTMTEYNIKLIGLSKKAIVTDIVKDMIQISFDGDENRSLKRKWFPFSTIYSTADGTGWYCMPEPGDEVRILFPDEWEKNAYAVSSVHMAADTRINPEEKSFINRQKKEIIFTPNSIILRNNRGTSIELSDKDGISLITDKNILLKADDNIKISSNENSIEFNGNTKVEFIQDIVQLKLENDIIMSGGKIFMN